MKRNYDGNCVDNRSFGCAYPIPADNEMIIEGGGDVLDTVKNKNDNCIISSPDNNIVSCYIYSSIDTCEGYPTNGDYMFHHFKTVFLKRVFFKNHEDDSGDYTMEDMYKQISFLKKENGALVQKIKNMDDIIANLSNRLGKVEERGVCDVKSSRYECSYIG